MDVAHGMALCLNTNVKGQVSVLTINRNHHAGYYNQEDRLLVKALLPHVRNIYSLHQHMSWLHSEAKCFRIALDQLHEGVYLLGKNGYVLFANEQALFIESKASFLHRRHQKLIAVYPRDEIALNTALARIAAQENFHGNESLGLRDINGRLVATITLCPLPCFGANLWSEPKVMVIAFVRELNLGAGLNYEFLQSILKLTAAEARLARYLMQGNSLDEAAAALCVTKNTLRTQLRSLFSKTDTHRQSDLLRLLLRMM
jgi:DNA-binding CsgD family transcriptional regulator